MYYFQPIDLAYLGLAPFNSILDYIKLIVMTPYYKY